jgi:small subunit ribosomal protein S9
MISTTNLDVVSSVGRRKRAVAWIQISPADEQIKPIFLINGKSPKVYLQFNAHYLNTILLPLEILNITDKFNINIQVKGGGLTGQVESIKLGLARALCLFDQTHRTILKSYGFLTRDSRIKESKKYGLKKARKASQYSKR